MSETVGQPKTKVKRSVMSMRGAFQSTQDGTFKIALISLTYPPVEGGIASHLAEVAQELAKRGFEVHIVTRRSPGSLIFEQAGNLFIHRIATLGPRLIASPSFIVRTIICLHEIKPCLVHSHEMLLPTTTSALYKLFTRTPVVTTVHCSGPDIGEAARLERSMLGVLRQYWLPRQVDYFIVISQIIEKELRVIGVPKSKLVPIPNGIDMERFTPSSDSERVALRRQLGLPEGFIVIYTGRLDGIKRVENLISVWANIQKVFPEATLLIVGTGPDEDALRRSAGSGIVFTGNVKDVATYLRAANLFVLPSISEGFSLSTLEALACGLPVIATRVGAIPELIQHGQNGWIVDADNLKDLENALIKLIDNPALCASFGLAGRRSVERDYSISSTTSKLADLYSSAIGNSRESAEGKNLARQSR